MSKPEIPQFIVADWQIDMTYGLDAVVMTFHVGEMKTGPQQLRKMAPIGLKLDLVRKLHGQLGELLVQAARRGNPGPGADRQQ